jgi:hypothetical protein
MRRSNRCLASSPSCSRRLAGGRARWSVLGAPCCCRRSVRPVRNGNWSSGSTTTCCSAGLSGSASRTMCGTPRASPRTGTGCWGGDEPVPRGSAVAKQGQEVVVERPLLGRRHIVEAWASPKSFRPKDGSGELPGRGRNSAYDFRGERRKNDIHASTIDPDARLYRKGPDKEARLCFIGHALMERLDRRRGDDPCFGPRLATGRAGADKTACRAPTTGHAWCR